MQLIDSLDQSFTQLGERMTVSGPAHSATPVSAAPHADEWAALVDAAPLPATVPASAGTITQGASAAVNLLD